MCSDWTLGQHIEALRRAAGRGTILDVELVETLRLIIDRCEGRTHDAVSIPMEDFPWYNERDGQLSKLHDEGIIAKPFYSDNKAYIRLTSRGRHFFDVGSMPRMLTESELYAVLVALRDGTDIMQGIEALGKEDTYRAVRQLQNEGLIAGVDFAEGGRGGAPLIIWLNDAYITMEGRKFLSSFENAPVTDSQESDLLTEIVSACAKIADNPASYAELDEDGLNRELRNFLDSALTSFGYSVSDQSQQGIGNSGKRPGELDIRITKGGIPIAILEGLIHKDRQYLHEHIQKATGRYNLSGCKDVFVIEYSRNKDFGRFWASAREILDGVQGVTLSEFDAGLLGVRALRGTFAWGGACGALGYVGVNCARM